MLVVQATVGIAPGVPAPSAGLAVAAVLDEGLAAARIAARRVTVRIATVD